MRNALSYWLILLWVLWVMQFPLRGARRRGERRAKTAPAALLGVIVQSAAYAIVWASSYFRMHTPEWWRAALSLAFGTIALLLLWSALPALGKQWRVQAGVYEDHVLVQTGAYRIVRHPIYASMVALLLATGFARASLTACAVASAVMIIGTEIRVRAEERLLAGHFGRQFAEYRARVPAYLPFLR